MGGGPGVGLLVVGPRRSEVEDGMNPVRIAAAAVVALAVGAPATAVQVIHVPGQVGSLQSAIGQIGNGGVIEMAAGTYTAPGGGWVVSNLGKSFTIRAAAGATVVLDGANVNPVVTIINGTPSLGGPVTFKGLTFYRGRSTTNGLAGGVTVIEGDATFVDCVFSACSCQASSTGGGGAAVFTNSRALFERCRFLDNWATNEGGALRVGGGSTAWVVESELLGNSCNPPGHRNSSAGGAIHVGDSTVWVANTRLEANEAGYVGGGLYLIGTWTDPVSVPRSLGVVANCAFVDNRAVPDPSVTQPGPTEAGAMHAEDQTTALVYNSRFTRNSADTGGGLNLFRAQATVEGCVFRGNRASSAVGGWGFGGAVSVLSNDGTVDGSVNRRSGQLTMADSLVQGRYGSVTTVGQVAGGLYVTGDQARRHGLGGVTPTAPASETRALATLNRVVFADCDVLQTTTGGSWGGGLDATLTELAVTDGLFVGSDALTGTSSPVSGGGAARVILESNASFNGTTFAANSGSTFGGAVNGAGAATSFTDCRFVENYTTAGTSYGRALFTGPVQNAYGVAMDASGIVSGTTFSNNGSGGVPAFDNDAETGAINDVRYNGNTFYRPGSSQIYVDDIEGTYDVPGLNALIVTRASGRNTDKSAVNNVAAGSAQVVGAIRAVPPRVLPTLAAGEPGAQAPAYLGYAWSGAAATLDGVPVSGNWGVAEVGAGTFTLSVGGTPYQATVAQGPTPAAAFTASPSSISSGQSATLSWATTAGTFIGMTVDQGVAAASAASGSVVVSPSATTTYRLVVVTKEGAAVREATVFVDEPVIFSDGFNSGTTAAWSVTVP